jgi:hypothetical protein
MDGARSLRPPIGRRRDWLLIGSGLVVGLGLLLFLVPIARAAGGAVAAAIAAHGGLIALVLLAFAGLLLLGIIRIVFAYGRRLEAQARQAEIVRLQNDQPIHIGDVTLLAARLAPHALDRYYDVRQLEAANSQFPQLTTYHHTPQLAATLAQPVIDAPALPAPSRPALPDLTTAISRGWSAPERWLVGCATDGAPQQIVLKHTGFIAISGVQGTGKTNTAALLAAQCAAHGGYLFVADPHHGDDESLSARIAPLSGAVERFAVTPDEIARLIAKVDRIYQARCRDPRQIDQPILLLIDEFMELMIRGQLDQAALASLLALSGSGRKKQIVTVLIAQNWSAAALGHSGVAIRQNTTHALVHASSEQAARFLLPRSYAAQAQTLRPGQVLFFGVGEPQLTTVPELSDADRRYAARGRPLRPYTPRPPAAPVAPTTRVAATPAPPTVPLTPPTIPEQITALLAARPWLTSTEIATALGLKVESVRTKLAPLERTRAIVRREAQRAVPEKFEYALNGSINQPTLTVSA